MPLICSFHSQIYYSHFLSLLNSSTSTSTQTALTVSPPLFDKSSGFSSGPFCSTSAKSDPVYLPPLFLSTLSWLLDYKSPGSAKLSDSYLIITPPWPPDWVGCSSTQTGLGALPLGFSLTTPLPHLPRSIKSFFFFLWAIFPNKL